MIGRLRSCLAIGLAFLYSLGPAAAQPGGSEFATKIYDSEVRLSNLSAIPESTDIAILLKREGRVLRIPVDGGEPSVLLDISSRMKTVPHSNKAC